MDIRKTLYVARRQEWRAWLEKHHQNETEVWLIYYKKQSGKPRIPYEDAVEEALCFGWIDSLVRRIDEERFAQKFTPRRADSEWSELNRKRIRKLIREGRMTDAGRAKISPQALRKAPPRKPEMSSAVPAFMKNALVKDGKAWDNFVKLALSHRKAYIFWISEAKKPETRQRRLMEAVRLLKQSKKLGLK